MDLIENIDMMSQKHLKLSDTKQVEKIITNNYEIRQIYEAITMDIRRRKR